MLTEKISFEDLSHTCQALGRFADARARIQGNPNKDLILSVKKINGRNTLQTVQLSKIAWYSRLIRCLGFGGLTLKAVARFLEKQEPDLLTFKELSNVTKKQFKLLKKQKIQGYEVFKRCLVHHNKACFSKVYLLPQEREKIDLSASGRTNHDSWPNPMVSDDKKAKEKYKAPHIDENEFLYLDPFFRKGNTHISSRVLGFCYEFGLGTQINKELAILHYKKSAEDNEYSSCYNLGRLLLDSDLEESIVFLEKAKTILLEKIDSLTARLEKNEKFFKEKLENQPDDSTRAKEWHKKLNEDAPYTKSWHKALKKIDLVMDEAYKKRGDLGIKNHRNADEN